MAEMVPVLSRECGTVRRSVPGRCGATCNDTAIPGARLETNPEAALVRRLLLRCYRHRNAAGIPVVADFESGGAVELACVIKCSVAVAVIAGHDGVRSGGQIAEAEAAGRAGACLPHHRAAAHYADDEIRVGRRQGVPRDCHCFLGIDEAVSVPGVGAFKPQVGCCLAEDEGNLGWCEFRVGGFVHGGCASYMRAGDSGSGHFAVPAAAGGCQLMADLTASGGSY